MQDCHMAIVTKSHFSPGFHSSTPLLPLSYTLLCLCLTCFPWCSYMITVCLFTANTAHLYISKKSAEPCGYCVLSLYFPHILLFHFFSVTLSYMHRKYSRTCKSTDLYAVKVCLLCLVVCQSIRILLKVLCIRLSNRLSFSFSAITHISIEHLNILNTRADTDGCVSETQGLSIS